MALLTEEQLKLAAEKGAEAVWEYVLLPAIQKLVDDSENKWDNAALDLAKGLVKDAIDSISDKDGD